MHSRQITAGNPRGLPLLCTKRVQNWWFAEAIKVLKGTGYFLLVTKLYRLTKQTFAYRWTGRQVTAGVAYHWLDVKGAVTFVYTSVKGAVTLSIIDCY